VLVRVSPLLLLYYYGFDVVNEGTSGARTRPRFTSKCLACVAGRERGRYAHAKGGQEGALAMKSGLIGGRAGVCGDQTNPVAAEYIYGIYDEDEGLRLRRGDG